MFSLGTQKTRWPCKYQKQHSILPVAPRCLSAAMILFLYNHTDSRHHLICCGWSKVDLTVPTLCPDSIGHKPTCTSLSETLWHELAWSKRGYPLRCWTVKQRLRSLTPALLWKGNLFQKGSGKPPQQQKPEHLALWECMATGLLTQLWAHPPAERRLNPTTLRKRRIKKVCC